MSLSLEYYIKSYAVIRDFVLGFENQDIFLEDLKNLGKRFFGIHHFRFGMQIRNLLRKKGLDEATVGLDNWDDHYYDIFSEVVLFEFDIDLESVEPNEEYIKKYYSLPSALSRGDSR